MADAMATHQQVYLSYRQASEIAWAIAWPTGLLYFGSQLLLTLFVDYAVRGVSSRAVDVLSDFLRLLVVGFFPMVVRRALNVRYKTGFRIEVAREKADPAAL